MKFYFLLFFIFISSIVSGQNKDLFRIIENGKYGFINNKGKVVIEPQFLFIGDFYGNLATARTSSGSGYIGRNGEFLISPKYDYAGDFYDTIAMVILDSKKYLINRKGSLKKYTDSAYSYHIKNFKETYASCDDSNPITLNSNIRKGNREFQGYQIINSRTGDTIYTCFDEIDHRYPLYHCESNSVFRKDLMLVMLNDKLSYTDTLGNIVWQAQNSEGLKVQKLNLDFRIAQEGNCTRLPKKGEKIKDETVRFDSIFPIIRAFPKENAVNAEGVVCLKVKLYNNSLYPDDTIYLNDTDIFFKLQIKNDDGKWLSFESDCGICVSVRGSGMPDTLIKMPPGYYWTFSLPSYDGTHKGTFRYKLSWSLSSLYSNEFEGRYNPSQLINKGVWFGGNEIEKYFGPTRSHEYIPKNCRSFMNCGSDLEWGKCYEDE